MGKRVGILLGVFLITVAGGCASEKASPPVGGPPPTPTGPVTVTADVGGALGDHLTASGHTVYVFLGDTSTLSSCNGDCAVAWPPVATVGEPVGGTGVTKGLLSSVTRGDGSTQVVYAGHPLYYYAKDAAAGEAKGQGLNEFGALWWAVDPAGKAITTAASSAPDDTGGGY